MFDKIELRTKHLYLTPNKFASGLPLLIISHGSGGISDIEIDFAKLACSQGYEVAVVDHFTPRGVKNQTWHKLEGNPSFEDRVADIQEISKLYKTDQKNIFGISAGATAALMASEMFDNTFCVYPALAVVTDQMLKAKNVTIVTGEDDDWTPVDQAIRYASHIPADLLLVPGYHGYLNPRQNRFVENVISLRGLKFDIPYTGGLETTKFERGITQKYNEQSRLLTEQKFIEWLS